MNFERCNCTACNYLLVGKTLFAFRIQQPADKHKKNQLSVHTLPFNTYQLPAPSLINALPYICITQ